jgi:hypothetical protein
MSFNNALELFCFLLAIIFLYRERGNWKIMIGFLLIVCVTELTGRYIKTVLHTSNYWVYNIFMLAAAVILPAFFYTILDQAPFKKAILITGWLTFAVLYTIELIEHGMLGYNSKSDTLLSVFLCVFSLLYYYQLLLDERHHNLATLPSFWWVNGVLFFYFGSITCDLFFSMLIKVPQTYLRYYIYTVLNILLYGCWSYAFLCKYQQRNYLS